MKHVFGPFPSHCLGNSLGINTVPLKTCNWNCVYCHLGHMRPLTNQRREYIPRQEILDEVRRALAVHRAGKIDWITFVGSGEPTLNSELGWLIRQVQSLTSLPVAVMTNGSLLYLPEVRAELAAAEAVLPMFDAGDVELFHRINRPHSECNFEQWVDGLTAFRQEYTGKLWIEVMLVRGVNDGKAALQGNVAVLKHVRPDWIHLVLPSRLPAETWVQPPNEAGLMRARAILGQAAQVVYPLHRNFEPSCCDHPQDAVEYHSLRTVLTS